MRTTHSGQVWLYILFPAVAMMLGWGLRGYIGGGPFAAMIPGAFVALSLSLLLGHRPDTAAMVALFGAIGVGYGGDMTYGQTLGLAQDPQTALWGFLGVTVKGAVWGLLGGAVLGVGLTRRDYDSKSLTIAFLLTVAAFYLGWKLINEPKLIYFSNRFDKPRDESWAGLLFAAIAFLACVRIRAKGARADVPLRFAIWGLIGGGLGFGLGTLWLAYGKFIPVEQKFFGWWKMMEFSFGLLFGAFLGLAAYLYRDRLADSEELGEPPRSGVASVLAVIAIVMTAFWIMPVILDPDYAPPAEGAGFASLIRGDVTRIAWSFIFFGALCMVAGIRSTAAAWQVALTITYFHTAVDFERGLNKYSELDLSATVLLQFVVVSTFAFGAAAALLANRRFAVPGQYLLLLWACYVMSCLKTFLRPHYYSPAPDSPGLLATMRETDPGMVLVHGIFTVSAILTTLLIFATYGASRSQSSESGRAGSA